jgi:hypothetical protein
MLIKVSEGSARERLTVSLLAPGGRPGPRGFFASKAAANPSTIPELAQHPETIYFLNSLNRPESVFRSVWCSGIDELSSNVGVEFTSATVWSVAIAREVVSLNTHVDHDEIVEAAEERFGKKADQNDKAVRMRIVSLSLVGSRTFDVHALKMEIWGLGTDVDESRSAFAAALRLVRTFFEDQSRARAGELLLNNLKIDDVAVAAR